MSNGDWAFGEDSSLDEEEDVDFSKGFSDKTSNDFLLRGQNKEMGVTEGGGVGFEFSDPTGRLAARLDEVSKHLENEAAGDPPTRDDMSPDPPASDGEGSFDNSLKDSSSGQDSPNEDLNSGFGFGEAIDARIEDHDDDDDESDEMDSDASGTPSSRSQIGTSEEEDEESEASKDSDDDENDEEDDEDSGDDDDDDDESEESGHLLPDFPDAVPIGGGWVDEPENNIQKKNTPFGEALGKRDAFEDEPEQTAGIQRFPRGFGIPFGSGYNSPPKAVDSPSTFSSKAFSRWSAIEATKERKIITCLSLVICCLCCFMLLGIGIGVGIALKNRNDDTTEAPSSTPSMAPSLSRLPSSSPSTTPSASVFPSTLPSLRPSAFPSSSLQPSQAPSLEPILALIIANSFDAGVAVLTDGTPQRAAYEWLLLNADLETYSNERKLQRYALATFFFATDGTASWDVAIRNGGWLTDAPECEWTTSVANPCTDGIYTSLSLDSAGVAGTMPLEIGNLPGLTRISIQNSQRVSASLGGTLPFSLGNLTNMETLRLEFNVIRGSIPTEIGLMSNLGVILLGGNVIGGSIPPEIANTAATTINLERNEIRGVIPADFYRLVNLTSINLRNNRLTGTIQTDIGSLGNLNSINLSSNGFDGTIPTEIGVLSAIRGGVYLHDNNLSGPLPSEVGLMRAMRVFEVQNNELTGVVPDTLSTLVSIRRFRIDGNPSIFGSMPQGVCDIFNADPLTISYSDCTVSTFTCDCCTFCCENESCACQSSDQTLCNDSIII